MSLTTSGTERNVSHVDQSVVHVQIPVNVLHDRIWFVQHPAFGIEHALVRPTTIGIRRR